VIRTRLNAMIEQPATVTLSGVASVSYAENIKALERRLVALARLDDDPSDDIDPEDTPGEVGIVQLVRSRGR
jgi:hypothetical protein